MKTELTKGEQAVVKAVSFRIQEIAKEAQREIDELNLGLKSTLDNLLDKYSLRQDGIEWKFDQERDGTVYLLGKELPDEPIPEES